MTDDISRGSHFTRRAFFKSMGALGVTAGVGALGIAYGYNVEPHRIQVERVALALPRLPGAFDGLTIAHLSDLHLGPYVSEEHLLRAVQMTNALKPDVIALTGDLVNSSWRFIQPCAEIISKFEAPLGVYAVLGNHDYWVGFLELMLQQMQKARVTLLRNQAIPLTRGGSTIYLVGIDDLLQRLANVRRALDRVPANACKIALMHEPDFADISAQAEIDLQLSGHSHGGQVRLPFIGPLVLPKYGKKYPMGLYRVGNFTRLYTTRGVGVLPPAVRFNCPPEITLLTLTTT
ncbi:MAG: metallophosphoesterase [Chloroflexota bacterium]|nr:MAG: metallophosphoesterase [Chloroflexota bacterium]